MSADCKSNSEWNTCQILIVTVSKSWHARRKHGNTTVPKKGNLQQKQPKANAAPTNRNFHVCAWEAGSQSPTPWPFGAILAILRSYVISTYYVIISVRTSVHCLQTWAVEWLPYSWYKSSRRMRRAHSRLLWVLKIDLPEHQFVPYAPVHVRWPWIQHTDPGP